MESIIYAGMDVHRDTYSLYSFDAKRSLLFSPVTDEINDRERRTISQKSI